MPEVFKPKHTLIAASAALFTAFIGIFHSVPATAQPFSDVHSLDKLVDTCLSQDGVAMIPDTDVLCYNAAIFPEQFLKLNDLPPASQVIITSPGGNVATARLMSTILDRRAEPAVIAGPCMSACAMIILPALDKVAIHQSAHIAVHGITMLDYSTWWGWLRQDAVPSTSAKMLAQLGYDFGFTMHDSGRNHVSGHLEGQDVAEDYIHEISEEMLADALGHDCRVDPKNYWGILDADHLTRWLGDRITILGEFTQSWDDPNNRYYRSISRPIGAKTYIFESDYAEAQCVD